jgi:pilus assembly protein CpaE
MQSGADKSRVQVFTGDAEFEQLARTTFEAGGGKIELAVAGAVGTPGAEALDGGATVAIVDLDAGSPEELDILQKVLSRPGRQPPVIAILREFNQDAIRRLLQMRVADFLVRPVSPVELVRACARGAQSAPGGEHHEANIVTFLPAVGGAGVTTLAIQSALILLENSKRPKSTCLVDLDFQHGACADYLDIEPRLDLKEIEPRPDRLDSQLLEVMTAYHASGLAVISAPNRPAEMRSFDPDMVTHLLDLVSSHFDHVVIDMPRTWFSWTDNVLLGSNRVFIVSEMTVPAVKHARKLVAAISERLGDGPSPQVIVNRFEQHMFGSGLRKSDIDQALGGGLAGVVPNDYRTVREAIDRGVPLSEVKANNKITQALRPLVLPPQTDVAAAKSVKFGLSRLKLSWAK